MSKGVKDVAASYRLLADAAKTQGAARLRFDRGTLLLEDCVLLPPGCDQYFHYDPRVAAYRAPAHCYSRVISALKSWLSRNQAPFYRRLSLTAELPVETYPHQREALAAWQRAQGQGLVVLPTGAGKTLVGVLALCWAGRDALTLVPTLDLMQQWYALLRLAFPQQEIGLLGGGYHEIMPLTVATYDSASRHMERLGNRFGMLIFDEAHHLPSEYYRSIAEDALAPYRLGLTATPERSDGKHEDLVELIGPTVYRKQPEELAGNVLASFCIQPVLIELSPEERISYQKALDERNRFLQAQRIGLGSLQGWNRFVMCSARSADGRRAMQAHQQARRIALATPAKLRALAKILATHPGEKTVIFTEDNATAYEVSQRFLIPCLTHQTAIKERQGILDAFKAGTYKALVTSKVLNEGVDVPDAAIGVILSGSASAREFVQRLGRILRRSKDKRAVLYELVSRETREERVAERRRGHLQTDTPVGKTLSLFTDLADEPAAEQAHQTHQDDHSL